MVDDDSPIEQIAFLARSAPRVHALEHLLSSGPTTRREFRNELAASRSTVTRTLAQLEERGWLSESEGTYRLTLSGQLITEQFLSLTQAIQTTEELSPFLNWFPYTEFDLDLDLLTDAEITASTPADPYAPGKCQTEFIETHSQFRGLLPSIEIDSVRAVHERIMTGEFESELVVSDVVGERITTGEFARLFQEQLETGQVAIHVVDGGLPFFLGRCEDSSVQLGVEDDEGFPRALLETENDALAAWADSVYETYLSRADRMPVGAFENG